MRFVNSVLGKIFGNKHAKDIKKIRPIVDEINKICEELRKLSEDELRGQTSELKNIIEEHLSTVDTQIDTLRDKAKSELDLHKREVIYNQIDQHVGEKDKQIEVILEQILPRAFALVKEVAYRFSNNEKILVQATDLDKELSVQSDYVDIEGTQAIYYNSWAAAGSDVIWNMVHYDVQLIGGIMLHRGKIAEMATGEGKTLVATLPIYLNALAGQGVHVVTVNDYLARRDSEWMAPIFSFLGLKVDCIDKYRSHSIERKKAYAADVTYGTNNEFGFDYLRDNMAHKPDELVQRKPHYAIIDEVDSVLIDDARTPLIISGAVENRGDQKIFYDLRPRIEKLYTIQRKIANQYLTEAKQQISEGKSGIKDGGLALFRAHRALPKQESLIKYLSQSGIKQILQKTENYYLQDKGKEMPTVDEPLLFTIEEQSNSVHLTEKGVELITDTGEDENFFILPDVGSEVAHIEQQQDLSKEEKIHKKDELMQSFAVKSERLHVVNQLLKAYTLFTKDVEYVVMDRKVKIVDENTGRIMDGRRYSDGLHQAIEAKENVKVEASSQTFATVTLQNYFKMYHKLSGMTGTAETEASEFWEIYKLDVVIIPTNKPIAREDKEDLIFKTKKEKYNALIGAILDYQKAGRPILVGTTNVEVSEIISKALKNKNIAHNVLNAKQHSREADIIAHAGKAGSITIATNMAGRGTDIKIDEGVKQAGGLVILGSERHESRRIDRQLRGRAGRQGDPGLSQFYISLEDDLMRIFGSERIAKVMDRLGYEEGEVIQHSMVSKSIERAQKKVEENNFGIRKHLLEYDDVMNTQREVVYKKRKHALFGNRLKVDISNSFYDLCREIVEEYKQGGDFSEFQLELIRYFSLDTEISAEAFEKEKVDSLTEKLYSEVIKAYDYKSHGVSQYTRPVFENVFKEKGEAIGYISVPFTDGKRVIHVTTHLGENLEDENKPLITSLEKSISLALIDEHWKDHLRLMDSLRTEVRTAQYEQKDPLVIYKIEGFKLFQTLISEMNKDISSFLFKANLPLQEDSNVQRVSQDIEKKGQLHEGRGVQNSRSQDTKSKQLKAQPVRVGEKIGRNDPCPCGSGKKYKKCHGIND